MKRETGGIQPLFRMPEIDPFVPHVKEVRALLLDGDGVASRLATGVICYEGQMAEQDCTKPSGRFPQGNTKEKTHVKCPLKCSQQPRPGIHHLSGQLKAQRSEIALN